MSQAFTLIAMGFSFALIGLGNIWIALEGRARVSEPLQWLCITFFAVFVLAGVVRAIFELLNDRRS